jgi:dTDP-glucose 4,6-dehydratase
MSCDLVLVYGSRGWIGSQFIRLLHDAGISFINGSSRVDEKQSLETEIKNVNPSHVVSFIGRTHGKIGNVEYPTIDYLEQPGKLYENVRDNLFSPLVLADVCSERNIHFTYLGTGCIFTYDEEHTYGDEGSGFTEESRPNFFGSGYSCIKGFTDRLMSMYCRTTLNLRIRMPISYEKNKRNFITKITTYDKICSIPNSMSVLPDLLPLVIDMMKKHTTGTINLTNPGLITHNEILEMFTELVDPSFEWTNFTIEEQRAILSSERSNNCLDTTKLESLYPEVPSIKTSMRNVLARYKTTYVPKIAKPVEEKIKCLFITGGAGFIGSNFVNSFVKMNPNVMLINFDALYYCGNENNVDECVRKSRNYKFIKGNLGSYDLLRYIFQTHDITHVLHFAAQSHVQTSFTDALQYTQDNIVGTHNLLEVTRLYCKSLVKFVHVSTDEVYGQSLLCDTDHKTEKSILCPTNPYAATKAAAELLAQSYHHSFKMPIIITRGNNVYGPNQYDEKVIPRFISQLKNDKKITIQGDGSCMRSFLHSSDVVSAFDIILKKGVVGEIYNIGCDSEMEFSIFDLGKILIKLIKGTDEYDNWIEYIEDRPFNDQRYYISNEKVKNLGWEIKVDLMTGLQSLVKN